MKSLNIGTLKLLFFLGFFAIHGIVRAQSDYYFFSAEDIENIKASSKTDWGQKIIVSLEQRIADRQQHSLRVSLMEGGHLHHYFCPKHNIMFEFDWEKPFEHYCRLCDACWENEKRYDWAWVNVAHARNLDYLVAGMYLYIATGKPVYAEYIRDMMLDYASKYSTYFEHNTNRIPSGAWGGRMFGQSLDEAVWASDAARAYMIAKPVMTEEEIRKIEDGYLKVCAKMLLERRGAANWQVWHNSGLVALGVALGDDKIIDIALNDPQCGYRHLMDVHVYGDGWWNEGSPIYHYYPLRAMLLTADAVRCRNINLYDKKLYNMFASPAAGVYADLYFPAHNDGWYGESLIGQVKLYEIAYLRYKDDFLLKVLKACYQHTERNSVEALHNNIDPKGTDDNFLQKSVCFEDVGFAVLRSGDKSVVLKYGPHGGGHGHPDKLSISVHNGRKEIVTDMGTSAYGVPDFTQWYRKTLSHSTLVVDAHDQKETTGKLLEFKLWKNGGYAEAESNEAYPGVDMKRSLSLKGDKLTDIFTASSDKDHLYDYVLMLTEKPIFEQAGKPITLDDAAVYQRISATESRSFRKTFSCKVRASELKIELLSSGDFEVITGEAPGIPPKNPTALNADYAAKPSYPLIVRTKSKDIKVKAEWVIK